MRRAPERRRGGATAARRGAAALVAVLAAGTVAGAVAGAAPPAMPAAAACPKPLYLTFDTGHMGVADHVAAVLARQRVRATFFLANETTLDGGASLDERWAPWWRARVAEGHVFGSHTWDHGVWQRDVAGGGAGAGAPGRFVVRPTMGPRRGESVEMDAAAYCAELRRPAERFAAMTGRAMAPLFRAPGGRTSPALLAAARVCGFEHVGWSPAGFLGDELPSDRHPNDALLARALRDVRAGDVLLAHLGIWSRREPWAPAVLEPLIEGLKARGFCFETLAAHPRFGAAVAAAR